MIAQVDSVKGLELATNTCVHYHTTGQSPYPYASDRYISKSCQYTVTMK